MTDSCLVLQISVSASFPEDTTGRSAGRCEKQEGDINCQETAPRNIQSVRGEHLGNNSLLLLALKPVVQYHACRGRAIWTGERKQSLYRVNCTIYKYSAGEGAAGVNYCSVFLVPKHSGIQDGIGVSVIAETQAIQEVIGVSVNTNYKVMDLQNPALGLGHSKGGNVP